MHLSLRWGGGGCHGDMSTKPRSKIGTFDKAVIGCPVTGSRGGVMGLPECIGRCRDTVTSYLLDATPVDQTGR